MSNRFHVALSFPGEHRDFVLEVAQALADKLHSGDLGEILLLRAYRMAGPTGSAATGPAPEGMSELEWQIRRFHGFLWASGGAVSVTTCSR